MIGVADIHICLDPEVPIPRRAGHRASYEGVDWTQYRAHVGIQQRLGPWRVAVAIGKDESAQFAKERGLPSEIPGELYTMLLHDERGLVMSDVPGEIAGCLDFLEQAEGRVLIGGLGLGILPAWLLKNRPIERIDVVEVDPDIIRLVARDEAARDQWARDPRLHVHRGDIHTFRWRHGERWDWAFFDIWDTVSEANLPSMARLQNRYAGRCGRILQWEHEECRAMHRRRMAYTMAEREIVRAAARARLRRGVRRMTLCPHCTTPRHCWGSAGPCACPCAQTLVGRWATLGWAVRRLGRAILVRVREA